MYFGAFCNKNAIECRARGIEITANFCTKQIDRLLELCPISQKHAFAHDDPLSFEISIKSRSNSGKLSANFCVKQTDFLREYRVILKMHATIHLDAVRDELLLEFRAVRKKLPSNFPINQANFSLKYTSSYQRQAGFYFDTVGKELPLEDRVVDSEFFANFGAGQTAFFLKYCTILQKHATVHRDAVCTEYPRKYGVFSNKVPANFCTFQVNVRIPPVTYEKISIKHSTPAQYFQFHYRTINRQATTEMSGINDNSVHNGAVFDSQLHFNIGIGNIDFSFDNCTYNMDAEVARNVRRAQAGCYNFDKFRG